MRRATMPVGLRCEIDRFNAGALRPCRSGSGRTRRPVEAPARSEGDHGPEVRRTPMRDRGRAGALCAALLAVAAGMHGA